MPLTYVIPTAAFALKLTAVTAQEVQKLRQRVMGRNAPRGNTRRPRKTDRRFGRDIVVLGQTVPSMGSSNKEGPVADGGHSMRSAIKSAYV